MKKKSKRWLTILIVAFLGIIGLNFGHVHADDDDDYKINQMDVDVIILPNGDAEVTRSPTAAHRCLVTLSTLMFNFSISSFIFFSRFLFCQYMSLTLIYSR